MIKQNLHTHTSLDHGKDTIEEMIQIALDKHFSILGFSGHSYNRPISSTCMSLENTELYKKQINDAKEKYKGQIELFCGIEQDSMNRIDTSDFDYVIGSVHYLVKDGTVWMVDESTEAFAKMLEEGWNGDIKTLIHDYYQAEAEMMEWPEIDIVGHIDLISKFNEEEQFFPFHAEWYLQEAKKAIDKGIEKGLVFEMNTGAIARGNRKTPYPHPALLEYMADHGAKLCINTDCHDGRYLDLKISECIERAKEVGFKDLYKMTPDGLVPEDIDQFMGDIYPGNPAVIHSASSSRQKQA